MLTISLFFAFASVVLAQEETNVTVSNVVPVIIVRRSVTVDAAFRYQGDLFLVAGDQLMAVSKDGYEKYVKTRSGDTEVPPSENLQAAVAWPKKTLVYFYGPKLSFRNDQDNKVSKVRAYGKARSFLQNGGPDAAAYRQGVFYIFKGCYYVAQRATLWHLGDPQKSTDLGLPCYPDAAWADADYRGMTVLKGNQIWKWREEVTGPTPFDEDYHIYTWQIKADSDDTFHL